jgi:hypothetical protein
MPLDLPIPEKLARHCTRVAGWWVASPLRNGIQGKQASDDHPPSGSLLAASGRSCGRTAAGARPFDGKSGNKGKCKSGNKGK